MKIKNIMSETILNNRDLNRATLARQMLLERESLPAPAAIDRLAGMQAQSPLSPYVGLWTRLRAFQREHLAAAIEDRMVIKATWLRATLHLVTAPVYLRYRSALQPMLTGAWIDIANRRDRELDLEPVLAKARAFIAAEPRTFAEISEMLEEAFPDQDVGAMRYGVRTHLPLVQVPIDNGWSYPGNPSVTLAEAWTGSLPAPASGLRELVMDYLAAFGPASPADMQTWSGLSGLKEEFEALRPELVTFFDAKRRELFDLPDAPRPPLDAPAPVRFLPEFDNLLLSHTERSRIVPEEFRKAVFLPGLRVASTFLVDGFVGGVWKVDKAKPSQPAAVMTLEPFIPLTPAQRGELEAEGLELLKFIDPQANAHSVEWKA